MAYQKFMIDYRPEIAPPGDSGDNGDKTADIAESVATVAGDTAPCKTERRIWRRADIMALPVMPCTTCSKFKWGRTASCEHYQRLEEPRTGCRCVHYKARLQ